MLDDKDRIFTNLYGQHDWGLNGARARGGWDGTKAMIEKYFAATPDPAAARWMRKRNSRRRSRNRHA